MVASFNIITLLDMHVYTVNLRTNVLDMLTINNFNESENWNWLQSKCTQELLFWYKWHVILVLLGYSYCVVIYHKYNKGDFLEYFLMLCFFLNTKLLHLVLHCLVFKLSWYISGCSSHSCGLAAASFHSVSRVCTMSSTPALTATENWARVRLAAWDRLQHIPHSNKQQDEYILYLYYLLWYIF